MKTRNYGCTPGEKNHLGVPKEPKTVIRSRGGMFTPKSLINTETLKERIKEFVSQFGKRPKVLRTNDKEFNNGIGVWIPELGCVYLTIERGEGGLA